MEAAQTQRELYAQLLPLQGISLLLPKLAVLEIQGMDAVSVETGGPAWLLGFGEWRSGKLPVVSLEAMAGQSLPARSRRSRLAVINSLGTHLDNGLFMILTQGYPHLTALTPAVLERQPDAPQDAGIALSRVRLANTDALIPDLEHIEQSLAEAIAGIDAGAMAATAWEPGADLTGGADSPGE